jgi:TetR/AcrR family transcriptional repressor of bet genes
MDLADTPPDQPRKMPRDDRRAQLIEATIQVIAAKGYARSTMSDVAGRAGLSHGLVNFHFQSKENLLLETLLYLAAEYTANWQAAVAGAGSDPADQLLALLMADFHPAICTPDRLSAWSAFWGEAASRPIYQDRCGDFDAAYDAFIENLCAQMNAVYGYRGQPKRVARILRVTIQGVWLDLMSDPNAYSMAEARATVLTATQAFFPNHFNDLGRVV